LHFNDPTNSRDARAAILGSRQRPQGGRICQFVATIAMPYIEQVDDVAA
jgi:hypothetical protein